MKEVIDQGTTIVRGLWRYRWAVVGVAWVVALVGWLWVHFFVVPKYTATAQLYVDTETVIRPLMKGLALDLDLSKQVNLMARQLMSRPNLERVVEDTKLNTRVETPVPVAIAVDRLRNNLSLSAEQPSRGTPFASVYKLSYASSNSATAMHVIQSLISAFEESTLNQIRRDSERAQGFIEQQIAEQEYLVASAASKLREFRRKHMSLLSADGRGFFERLQTAERSVADVEREIAEAEAWQRGLQTELDRTPRYTRAAAEDGSLVPTKLEAQATELRQELDELLLRYTEAHPDVVATRDRIRRVETQIREGDNPGPVIVNPVFQQLELRVREARSEIAALEARKKVALRERDAVLEKASTLPKIEDEFAELMREADNARQQLKALEERRRSMQISDTVDRKSLDQYFRVIDPPSVPAAVVLDSVWRKRLVLSAALVPIGMAAGLALAYLLYQLALPFFGRRSLIEVTGLPVLGVVSHFPSRGKLIRERLDFLAWVLSLVLMFGALGAALWIQKEFLREADALSGSVLRSDEKNGL
jgi:polysaccharide chain length determinant protein (PEP-CTERM system associated)